MHPIPGPRAAILLAAFFVALVPPAPAGAQPGRDKDPLSWDRNIHGLVRKYCLRCHTGDAAKGNVDLAQDQDPRGILAHRDVWQSARESVEAELMPPEKAQQPTEEERRLIVQFLAETLDNLDCTAAADPGAPSTQPRRV